MLGAGSLTILLAMSRWRSNTIFRLSAQLAQCAAPRKRVADLKPSPDDSGKEAAAVAEGDTESGSTWRSWQRHLQIPLSCFCANALRVFWACPQQKLALAAAQYDNKTQADCRSCNWNGLQEGAVFLCFLLEDTRTRTQDGPQACPERRHLDDRLRDLDCPSIPRPLGPTLRAASSRDSTPSGARPLLFQITVFPKVESNLGVPPHFFFQNDVSIH